MPFELVELRINRIRINCARPVLINQLVNVAQIFTDILKCHFLQTNAVELYVVKNYLNIKFLICINKYKLIYFYVLQYHIQI